VFPSQQATRFFDAVHCPDCRGPLPARPPAGTELRCPGCGLPLSDPDAEHLASLLAEADRTLATLRQRRRPALAQDIAGTPAAPQAPTGGVAGYPGMEHGRSANSRR